VRNMRENNNISSKVLKIKESEEIDKIKLAASFIRTGKIVIIPTDTLYGLATNPFNVDAVKRIYEIKRRPLTKPIPLLISNKKRLHDLVIVNTLSEKLIERFWPGQLTIIFKMRNVSVPRIVTAGSDKLALRMPNHTVALKIIELSEGIITGTSANISGETSPKSVEEVKEEIAKKVDLIVDCGTALGLPSTIVDITSRKPCILREGAIKKTEVEDILSIKIDYCSSRP